MQARFPFEENQPSRTARTMQTVEGDPEAEVERLLEKYLPTVRAAVARRMGRVLRAREESLDLVQSVCRRALEQGSPADFEDERRFLSWLLRIVENKIVDRYRELSALKRGGDDEQSLEGQAAPEPGPTPSVVVQRAETVADVRAAIRSLPAELGRALELNEFEGLSYERLGERLGLTPKQARLRVAKAKMLLARTLAGEDARS